MSNIPAHIFHVTTDLGSAKDSGLYSCASLKDEGFIHCCNKDQLAGVLQRYYQGATDLQLLKIATDKLSAKLVYENTAGGQELFPHIYGQINMTAVIDISAI